MAFLFVSVIMALNQNSVPLNFDHINFVRTACLLPSPGNFHERGIITARVIINEYVVKLITKLIYWNIGRLIAMGINFLFASFLRSIGTGMQIVPQYRMRLPVDELSQLSTFLLTVGGYSLRIYV